MKSVTESDADKSARSATESNADKVVELEKTTETNHISGSLRDFAETVHALR